MRFALLLSALAVLEVAVALSSAGACKADTQASCDKNTDCTWCKSAAIPSKCYSRTAAKKLPTGVFSCNSASIKAVDHAQAMETAQAFAVEGNASTASTPRILVVGDSWGTVVAAGSKLGASFFARKLKEHGCKADSSSIAIPGATSTDWIEGGSNYKLLQTALIGKPDYVWMIILGNDALNDMQDCAENRTKTADQCGDELFAKSIKNMGQFADMVHKESPNSKLVGFGYDTMFGGLGCGFVTRALFPQCYRRGGGGNKCFNTQFLRIQGVWDTIAASRPWVHNTTILGATQVAGGDAKASTGADRHIDMDKMGPAKYWPDYEGCFHPGVLGGNNSGAMVVMQEFYRMFWSTELGC